MASNYYPVCCYFVMIHEGGGHHDCTREAIRLPTCGNCRVQLSSDRGLRWSDEVSIPTGYHGESIDPVPGGENEYTTPGPRPHSEEMRS